MKLEAVQIKVLSRRDNGSGVIEIPILKVTGGAATIDEMQEMVANHEQFPIVPVGVSPHRDFDERAGFSPGFLENPSMREGVLFAELDLIAPLFHEVVELGGWRSFSIEARENLKTTTQQGVVTRSIKGWVIVGGVFTNRPAVDAHFKIAAEAGASESSNTFTVPLSIDAPDVSGKGSEMAEQKPAPGDGAQVGVLTAENRALSADKKTLESRVTTLSNDLRDSRVETQTSQTDLQARTTELATATAQIGSLEAEQRGTKEANKQLTGAVTKLEGELDAATSKNLAAEVREIIETAIKPIDGKQGVPPRVFEGWEADPSAYMLGRFKDLEAFKTFVSALPGAGMEVRAEANPTSSAHTPGIDPAAERDADEIKLTAEEEAVLDRLDLPAEYDGVMDEVSARKVHKALEANKAKSKE